MLFSELVLLWKQKWTLSSDNKNELGNWNGSQHKKLDISENSYTYFVYKNFAKYTKCDET